MIKYYIAQIAGNLESYTRRAFTYRSSRRRTNAIDGAGSEKWSVLGSPALGKIRGRGIEVRCVAELLRGFNFNPASSDNDLRVAFNGLYLEDWRDINKVKATIHNLGAALELL
jgi:hypothetical protein